ncbi:hypothetical protein BH09PSE6_BH09PSE6_08420 [soil metagenome]
MTSMTIVRQIAARPSLVWEAVSTADGLRQWLGPDDGPVIEMVSEPVAGGRFHLKFRMRDGSEHESNGTWLVVDPPLRLVLSWQWSGEEADGESRVEIVLRPKGEGTELTFTHAQLPDEPTAEGHRKGWNGSLDKLVRMFPASALVPAALLAASMTRPARNANQDYLDARADLLAAEIEQRRCMENVAALRRSLPDGPAVDQDYVFQGLDEHGAACAIRLSTLFGDADSIVIYNYMFPRHKADTRAAASTGETAALPAGDQPCPSCTGLLDQLDRAALHFEAAGGRLVVVANTSLDNLLAVARDREWKHLRLLSSAGTTFKRDYHAEDDEGQQAPMMLVFKRGMDKVVRLFWASELVWADSDPGQDHRAAGTVEPFWTLLDFTPGGRPAGFHEQLDYACAGCAHRRS